MSAHGTASVNHRVGTCPCCGRALSINVYIEWSDASAPSLISDGQAMARMTGHITAAEMEHHCTRADR